MPLEQRVVIDDLVVRALVPEGVGNFPVILLLHGWTGDEDAMWIFKPRLPTHALILAPRALFPAAPGGYSWHEEFSRRGPDIDDFHPALEKLMRLINHPVFPQADFSELHLMGFSQGAAVAYAFTLLYPERAASVAGLAGFMPGGAARLAVDDRLKGLPGFVTHGTQDKLVPIEQGREAARLLEQAGALVTYCEDDVGHKLSANCFRGLESFYRQYFPGLYPMD